MLGAHRRRREIFVSQAETKARNAKEKRARVRATKARNKAAEDTRRLNNGAKQARAFAGDKARKIVENRRKERQRKKDEKAQNRKENDDFRKAQALQRQRQYDRDHRDMLQKQQDDEDQQKEDDAVKPKGPWEEQQPRETGNLKGRVVGSFNAETPDWANAAQSACEVALQYLDAGGPSDIFNAREWIDVAIFNCNLIRTSHKKFRQRVKDK